MGFQSQVVSELNPGCPSEAWERYVGPELGPSYVIVVLERHCSLCVVTSFDGRLLQERKLGSCTIDTSRVVCSAYFIAALFLISVVCPHGSTDLWDEVLFIAVECSEGSFSEYPRRICPRGGLCCKSGCFVLFSRRPSTLG